LARPMQECLEDSVGTYIYGLI